MDTLIHTVLMEPTVCSTTVPASAYAFCPRLDNLATVSDMTAPAMTIGGILDSMTSVKSHPLENAIAKPPTKVEMS